MARNEPIDTYRLLTVGKWRSAAAWRYPRCTFYESKGLIQATRNAGNQRRYTPVVLRYIAVIKIAQSAGIPLEEIRATLGRFPTGSKLTAEQWGILSSAWRKTLDERIQRLTVLRDYLDSCIGCGCLSLTDCPLRNPNDIWGQQGAGAHIFERPTEHR